MPRRELPADRLRRMCMALPDTTEKLSHGEPTFFVKNSVYVMLSNNHHNDGHVAVWVPAAPGVQEELIREAPDKYYRPPYVGPGGWVGIELKHVSDDELGAHLHEAWKLILAKKAKKATSRRSAVYGSTSAPKRR